MSKPVYRQSNIANYFDCPYKFYLSQNHELPSTLAMEDGRLFEALVLGAKDEAERSALFGRKKDKTIDSYTRAVEAVAPIFLERQTDSCYVKMQYEAQDWILRGEADYIGELALYGKQFRAIADLKFTGSITRIWMEKSRKVDFLQSAVYMALHYWTVGEWLPFVYLTVENIKGLPNGAAPITKAYLVQPDPSVLDWVLNLVDTVHNDHFPEPNLFACEDGAFRTRCKYLLHCAAGRKAIEAPVEIDFMELSE